jgi:hypothetical protein
MLTLTEHAPGSNGKVQFIPTLTDYHPNLTNPENTQRFGVDATKVAIEGTVGKDFDLSLSIITWFFHVAGLPDVHDFKEFSIGDSKYKIYDNTLKYDINMKGWPFVADSNLLQFTIRILTENSGVDKTTTNADHVSFVVPVLDNQDYASILFPSIVNVDGVNKNFDVKVWTHGENTDVTLEFPSFKQFLDYDPILNVPRRFCGNDVLDTNEECDYGFLGCNATCQCVEPYVPNGGVSCILPSDASKALTSLSAGVVVVVIVVIVVAILAVIAVMIKKKVFVPLKK